MRALVSVLLASALFTGCAAQQEYDDNSDMDFSVDLRDIHRCSRISPEFEIFDAPEGTASFDVILQEQEDTKRMHGGGSWRNDGSGIIPEGALTRHYMGACPPAGTSRMYQYVVKALDKDKKPLAIRKYVFEQE